MLSCGYYYVGSKGYMSKYIGPLLSDYAYYIEPFCGSFSCGFEIMFESTNITLSDIDFDVINFWSCVKQDVLKLLDSIDLNLLAILSRIRQGTPILNLTTYMNSFSSPFDRAAIHWIGRYINCGKCGKSVGCKHLETLINLQDKLHIYRVGLLERSACLQHSSIICSDYHVTSGGIETLVYLDPPYVDKTNGIFYGSNSDWFNHVELRDFLQSVKFDWVLSYDYNSVVAELYSFAHLVKIPVYNKFVHKINYEYMILSDNTFNKLKDAGIITLVDDIYLGR